MNDSEADYVNFAIELEKLVKTKQWDVVESYAKTIIQRFPNDIYVLKQLGIALVKQRKFNEAVTYYEKAVEVGKTFGAGHLEYVKQLDVLYRRLGRYEDAFQICSYYLSQDKYSKDAINRFNRSAKLIGRTELAPNLVVAPTNKRVPLGEPLNLTDADLTALATITPAQVPAIVTRAGALWRRYAPKGWESLLDAQPLEAPDAKKSAFVWDAARGVYICLSTGQVITSKQVRAINDEFLDAMKK